MTDIGTILVLESERPLQNFIGEALEDAGYSVLLASDRTSMYLALVAHEPDLLLYAIDHVGGRATAWLDTAHALAQPAVPIVLMTTEAANVTLPGIAACLVKPFGLDELLTCVAQYIGRSEPIV
jgi:DNA-binding response OmpR family regulator